MRLELSKHLWIFISTSSWLIFTNVCFAFGEQYSANNNCLICIKLPKIICIQCKRVHDFHNGGRSAKPGHKVLKALRLFITVWRPPRVAYTITLQMRYNSWKMTFQVLLSSVPKWTATFWRNLKQKLLSYYFTHFIKFASAEMHDGNCQVVSADSMVLQYVTTSATWCQIVSGCI